VIFVLNAWGSLEPVPKCQKPVVVMLLVWQLAARHKSSGDKQGSIGHVAPSRSGCVAKRKQTGRVLGRHMALGGMRCPSGGLERKFT